MERGKLYGNATKKLIAGKSPLVAVQTFRYVLSGGVAFIADVLVLHLLTEALGVHYVGSAVAGFLTGLAVTYLLSIRWVFDRRRMSSRWVEFVVFAAIGLVGLLLTAALMWFFTDMVGLHYLLSKIVTTVVVTGWNFTAKKLTLF